MERKGTKRKKAGGKPSKAPPAPASRGPVEGRAPEPARPALPDRFGVDQAVLLPRDPRTAFLFWEVREETLVRHRGRHRGLGELALRLTEAGTGHVLAQAGGVPRAGSWYFHLSHDGVGARAELGWVGGEGAFHRVLVSNPVRLPREAPASPRQGLDAGAGGRPFAEILRLCGGEAWEGSRGGASRPRRGGEAK